MLKIQLEAASKRFQYEWIFKNLNLTLTEGDSLAVTGGNGSGKSTLLKCISGAIPLTSGKVDYSQAGSMLDESNWFRHLSIAAPYMELPEEFSLEEAIKFHFKFKQTHPKVELSEIVKILYLDQHQSKQVGQFSSGMKQRLKLGLALFSDSPLVLLDEPTSNLDQKGIGWYQEMIQQFSAKRIILVCSNEPREFDFCQQKIRLEDYK